MKKLIVVCTFGVVGLAVAFFGFAAAFEALLKWQQWRKEEARRPSFNRVHPPAPAPLQPGLGFLENLDEVRFLYYRSFHDAIEVSVRNLSPNGGIRLTATITRRTAQKPEVIRTIEKFVTEDVFFELQSFVTRQDVIQRSLGDGSKGIGGTDGSTWYLEGRKGDFVIQHTRWYPWDLDPTFVAIGKRFLELADIQLPKDEVY